MRFFLLLIILFQLNFIFSQKEYIFDIDEIRARNFFNQGLEYFQDKSYEAAIKKFLSSLKVKNDNDLVRYYLGESFYKAGYTEQALDQWENILKLGRQDAHLVERINSIYYLRGKNKKSLAFDDYVYISEVPNSLNGKVSYSMSAPVHLHINDENEIRFLDYKANKIGKISLNGDYLGDYFGGITSLSLGFGGLKQPASFFPYKEGYLVSDFGNDRLVFINKKKGIYKVLGERGFGKKKLSPVQWLGPSGIALDELGNLFVVDTGNSRVSYIDIDGKLLFHFGSRGKRAEELLMPAGLAYNQKEKRVYVCDRGNNRISVFDNYGNFIKHISGFLLKPRQIIFHPFNEEIMVIVDSKDVYLYDKKRNVYKSIFYNITSSPISPKVSPLAASFDKVGHLYVADGNKGKIYIYAPLKLRYVNLNVRIENLQVKNFPQVLVNVSVYNKEGLPIVGLSDKNFQLTENGAERSLNLLQINKNNALKGILLIERSRDGQDREHLLEAFIKNFMLYLNEKDKFDFYAVGQKNDSSKSYHALVKNNNDVLPVLEAMDDVPYYSEFQFGLALRKTINDQIQTGYKRGILMVVFSDYSEKEFGKESYLQLIDFAKHNFIPISIVYLGQSHLEKNRFAIFKSITEKTKGQFFVYSNKEDVGRIVNGFKNFKDGQYFISYKSFENDLKSGRFRKLVVKVDYKNLTGIDNKGGFPIP